ncbi:hypothetical protein J437_LFUL001038 [Ladona fulva]|uniref:PiggyBac transposable element-derived protein domain-containing protein n=1 Tax=Ladona fulva TaxID=123851 RepID=A0A8K0KEQ5_LADFU|nr:hypothetical protein J437_LFUL001038 [Ladona fulva]
MASPSKRTLCKESILSLLDEESDEEYVIDYSENDSECDTSVSDSELSEVEAFEETLQDQGEQPRFRNPKDLQWSDRVSCISKYQFSGKPGVNVQVKDANDSLELFELYFDEQLVEMIVTETNRYAEQQLSNNKILLKYSRLRK